MLRVGDVVLHQKTGQSGIVIGYGHQILDGVYLPTLIVQLTEKGQSQKRFVEDLSSEWMLLEREQYSRIA
ncbi:hypothetical protein [Chroococcidiopsis sp. CCMEE 29]|uniref:hypothetical protein n=1 Tax=Chroococcidiopsis sp. CCMEE 29 TaxID=155894 RepID=UPI0020218D65|nr:hypothetical protein [Chroococcidiopsis sp. CCMEE 29]